MPDFDRAAEAIQPIASAEPILITGAGMITCLGLDRHAVWEQVRQGRCGIGPLTALEQPELPGKAGGQAPDLPPDLWPGEAREVRYLRRAMLDALADAGIDSNRLPVEPHRAGIMLGTTLHGMRAGGEYLRSGSNDPLGNFLAASVLRSASRGLAFHGFAATTCSACSSALGAIALGVTLLHEGKLDLILAGGYDPISEYVYAGFNSLRLVSEPPLRPFARDRQGMKLAEGYAVVVLERESSTRRRGGRAIATVLGFGESADAHHLTQPHPKGDGASRAVRGALESAGLAPSAIGLIAAHATGTPDNDAGEYQALRSVFGDALPKVPVVGFKSHVGHTLGGAGAVELILAAMAMAEGTVPPCANVRATDTDFEGLNLATGDARQADIRATLSTSLGFGGANTAMVLGPPPTWIEVGQAFLPVSPQARAASPTNPLQPSLPAYATSKTREVFVTGVGVLLPGAIGNDAFVQLLRSPASDGPLTDAEPILDEQISHLINARRVRRLSQYVKYTLAAAALALTDAKIADLPGFCETCAAVLGTTHGSTAYSIDYYGQIVREGLASANPLLFAEGVPNAAAAHLSLMMGIKGACQTIIGSRTAGLDGLRLAASRIAQGNWERAIVGAGEEYSSTVNVVYRTCRSGEEGAARLPEGPRGFSVGCGSVMLILESRASLEARGGRVLAKIESASAASPGRPSSKEVQRVIRDLGPLDELIHSESGLWLDMIEARGIELAMRDCSILPAIRSLYGKVAETFSAMPLAAIAAALLTRDDADSNKSYGILTTDVTGLVSGIRLSKP